MVVVKSTTRMPARGPAAVLGDVSGIVQSAVVEVGLGGVWVDQGVHLEVREHTGTEGQHTKDIVDAWASSVDCAVVGLAN